MNYQKPMQYFFIEYVICLMALWIQIPIQAQESEHNRIAVQESRLWQSNIGVTASLVPLTTGAQYAVLSLTPQADILYKNRWYASLSLPIYGRVPMTVVDMVPFAVNQGDLTFDGAWLTATNRGQHRIGIEWTIPTGVTEEVAEAENSLATGGRLHRFDLSWNYTRYADPVSLDGGIHLGTTIPGTYHSKPYWEPLTASITSGGTLLLNRWVAVHFNLSQNIALPPRDETDWLSEYLEYQAILSGGIWYTTTRHTFALELNRNMANPLEGLGVSLRYWYSILPKK
jgi:hypothetical protein